MGTGHPTVMIVRIYKYIRTTQTQNFRNRSKSALKKSKIYIYEQFLGKIFEIFRHLYMKAVPGKSITWGGGADQNVIWCHRARTDQPTGKNVILYARKCDDRL